MKITFTVEFPIVPKERPRRAKNGHFYTPSKTKRCETAIAYSFRAAAGGPIRFGGAVSVQAVLRPERSDLDNRLKTILDGLNGIAYGDDRQVREIHVKEVEGKVSTITVEEL